LDRFFYFKLFKFDTLVKEIYFNLFVKKYINQVSEVIVNSRNEVEYAKALRTAGPVNDGDTRVHFRVGHDW
jgi:hypothetical protein